MMMDTKLIDVVGELHAGDWVQVERRESGMKFFARVARLGRDGGPYLEWPRQQGDRSCGVVFNKPTRVDGQKQRIVRKCAPFEVAAIRAGLKVVA